MQEKLQNERIVLQRFKFGDEQLIYQAIKNSYNEISPWLDWLTPHYSIKNAGDFVRFQVQNWNEDVEYTYTIRNRNNDFIGVIGLHVFDNNNDVASIGYWVDSRYTRKGFCSDAVQLLVQNAIPQLNLIRVEIIVALNNHASQRVAEKAGACFEAILKNRIRIRGLPVDAKVFAFTNPA